MRGETAGKPLKYAGNGDFRRGTAARIINNLEMRMRRRRSALFSRSRGRTTAARKRPYNGISEAFRWYEPLGPVPEVTAADQEDESFAAHAAIVADAAADCKRGKRANGALERASFRENGAFRRGSAGIRACAGRARRARRGGEAGQNRRRAMGQICKTDGTVSHCPVFKGFRAFDPRFSPLHQWDRKQIYN